MKKQTVLLLLFAVAIRTSGQTPAEAVKFNAKNARISIDSYGSSLDVEGYDGDELIIEALLPDVRIDPPGMKQVSGDRAEHPLKVTKNEMQAPNLLSVSLRGGDRGHIRIRVPRAASLFVGFNNRQADSRMAFKNLDGELEIEGSAMTVLLDGISGPVTLSGGWDRKSALSTPVQQLGITDKIVLTNLKRPQPGTESRLSINILSGYADVDVSLPPDIKATIQVSTSSGELYSDLPIKPKNATRTNPNLLNKPESIRFDGELNGGGIPVSINAASGNIYLRAQK